MSTIPRTLRNIRKVGIKDYLVQMWYIGDTKHGRLVGEDRAGNKFFENEEELPLRTRWVQYAKHDFDAGQIEPGWHAWMSYMVDKAPSQDPSLSAGNRAFESSKPIPNFTMSQGAFKTYCTVKPKISAWKPVAAPRS
jgi:NADH:ubiquinone oxidoreductase subunit